LNGINRIVLDHPILTRILSNIHVFISLVLEVAFRNVGIKYFAGMADVEG
jgi:hypothetical protein